MSVIEHRKTSLYQVTKAEKKPLEHKNKKCCSCGDNLEVNEDVFVTSCNVIYCFSCWKKLERVKKND